MFPTQFGHEAKERPYSDEYGNDLRAGATDDLMAGSIRHGLCRSCGVWYHWDDVHATWGEGEAHCRRKELRG